MARKVNKLALSAALMSGVLIAGLGLSACDRSRPTATVLAAAKDYQAKGDTRAALIELKNAVANAPDDGEARLALGALYGETGDAVSSEKEIRKAMSLQIAPERTLPLLAQALLAQARFEPLLVALTPELSKNSAQLLALRGNALLALNRGPEAKAAFEQAVQLKPADGDALVGMARYALLQQDQPTAERYAAEAVAKDAANPEAWLFKGALARASGKQDEALAAYDKALALKPTHRSAHVDRAYIEIGQGKFDAARADLEAARKISPASLAVTYAQALLDYTQGKHAQALESLQKVLKSAPDHLPSVLLAGAVELNLGSTQQAEQHLRKYLETYPEHVHARKLLAQAQLKSAQPADAAATLAPILKNPSDDPYLLALAGQSAMQTREFDKAVAYFEKATTLAPKVASLHTSLGLSRLGQGDQARALTELERGASLDQTSPNAGIALVQAELGMKHYDKALAAVQELVKKQPDNAFVQNLQGGVYLSKGDAANARASFEKAVALQPTFLAAVKNLAQLDYREKKPDAAKGRFTALLQKEPKNIGAMTALADIATLERRPEEATKWLEKASNDNPEAVAPGLKLAEHYLRNKENQKALTLVRKLQSATPANPDLLDLLGQTQLASNDAAGALETYSKLVNVLPKSAPAQYRLAMAHIALKNEPLASDDLKRALALQPGFLPAVLAQVELSVRKGRIDDALALARQLQKQPANARVGLLLEADLLQQQQKSAPALALYEKAFALENTPKLIQTIHRLMAQSGKEAQADQRLAQWLKEHPADIETSMYSAERNLMKKQYKQAIAQFEAALKVAPNSPLVLNNLAWAYQQVNDPKALDTAEAAYKAGGDNPAVMDTLGVILSERGDTKRAVTLLQKAVTLAPGNPDLHLHLAQALIKAGDKANARKELELIVAKAGTSPRGVEAKELMKQL